MIHGAVTHIRGCNNPNSTTHNPANQRFTLILQYTDKRHDIKLDTEVSSPPTLTIHEIKKDLLEFLYLDDIPIEEIRLAGFSRNGRHQVLEKTDAQMTLQQLGVTNECILHFVPTPNASPPKLCKLTIVGPDEIEKKDFEWYRAKTTVGELLEYVIEHFSLQSVEQERIHLITIINELEFADNLDMRLSQFNLHSGMSVHVQIIPPLSRTTVNKNMNVHVECTYDHDKFMLHLPNTETIGELKTKIQKQFEGGDVLDFKLFNENEEEFRTNNPDRTLKSFGVKSGQTISATFRLITRNTQPPVVSNDTEVSTKSSASSITKKKSEKVIVICNYPPNNSETMHVSLKDTVSQLTKKIETKMLNQRLVISEMSSNNIKINLKNDTFRCLADLGFKSDDIINVTMIDKTSANWSIESNRSSLLFDTDKLPDTIPINLKPMGLVNLGDTCYMNSALQCLAHVLPLTNFFLGDPTYTYSDNDTHEDSNVITSNQTDDVSGAYADLLWNLYRRKQTDFFNHSFRPIRIKEIILRQAPHFTEWDQKDAKEITNFFFNAMHKELKEKQKNDEDTIIKQLFFVKMKSTITCTACDKEESTTDFVSFLSIPLSQQELTFWITFIPKAGRKETCTVNVSLNDRIEHLVQKFVESHHNEYLFQNLVVKSADGELDYNSPLNRLTSNEITLIEREKPTNNISSKRSESHSRKSNLEDYLAEFLSTEQFEDNWSCNQEKCQKQTTAIKQVKLCTLPPVLIIRFKRFSYENGLHKKDKRFIDYPIKGLNLTRFLPPSEKEAIYDLIAVSNHIGSIYGGHYTTFALHKIDDTNEWYLFDDSHVSLISSENDIISEDAYLLFYIKRNIL